MPAPSNPELKHPDCPECKEPVAGTAWDAAYLARVPGVIGNSLVWGTIPAGAALIEGAPDYDQLTLQPCGCELYGTAAHDYQRAALNLTWPDVQIDMRLIIPAGASGHDQPIVLEVTTTDEVADLLGVFDGLPMAVRARLRAMADQLVMSVPRGTLEPS